ncbi:MAG: hypothetical protein P9E24_09140 [Candidatus Competibacter sp.]|nr:hypothetical protein [Candidatus Competibacter sp.]MDG4582915.1 hypothetical protein [Candidatus Competibacter sp.]
MTKKHRHLSAALGIGAIAASLFVYVAWILITGEAKESLSGSGIQNRFSTTYTYGHTIPYKLYTRKDDPGVYWMVVGLFGFFGVLTAVVAVFEYRSYLVHRDYRRGENPSADLLARIDHACRLHPEERETLLRARAAVVDLKDADVEIALEHFLDKALGARDREAALKDIRNLAKALDRIGKY